jgi:hypothetical protein
MAYIGYKSATGIQRKTDATSGPDGSYRVCSGASFDELGATTSARGRIKLANGATIGSAGSVTGGFDGVANSSKYRFIKRGTAVVQGAVANGANVSATYSAISALKPPFLGGTAPTFTAANTLTGFTRGGYAYFADGTGLGRWNYNAGSPVNETWGLRAPGYHELSVAGTDYLSANNSTTVTVTLPSPGHGLWTGLGASTSQTMNIELVGMQTIGGIPDNEINCLHDGRSATNGAISVTSSGGTLDTGATYTVTFQNAAGGYDWPAMDRQNPTGAGHSYLSGGNITVTRTVQGSASSPVTDCVQTLVFTGTVTSGYYQLRVSDGSGGGGQRTADIAYNATAAEVQAALLLLPYFAGTATNSRSACTVTSNTAFTFTTPTASTGGAVSGGGLVGFMRAGPTLTEGTGGNLSAGKYFWAYTFYNGVAESNFSAQVPATVSGNAKMTLSQILMGPAGTTERRIYRTDVNGRQLYYIGKIADNTTLTYTDTGGLAPGADTEAAAGDAVVDAERVGGTTDQLAVSKRAKKRGIKEATTTARASSQKKQATTPTNLGLLSDWTDHDPAPLDLKHVGVVGETCFGISGGDIVFSETGNVEHWPLANRFTPNKNSAVELKTWLQFDRDIIAYTTNSVHRFSAIGLDYSDARLEEIESPVGCAGEYAAAALDGLQGHVVLTKAGLYLFDGARMNEISMPIEPLFTDSTDTDYITPELMGQACMVMSRDRMFLAYRHGSSATDTGVNNRILFGDFQDLQNPAFSILSFEAVSLWREKADNKILAGDSSGYVWEMDYGYTDNGSAIAWQLTTKEYQLAGSERAFRLDELILDADFAGATTTVTVTTRLRGNTRTSSFTSTATGRQRIKKKMPISLWGETVQVDISSSHAGKRSVYEVGFTAQGLDEP